MSHPTITVEPATVIRCRLSRERLEQALIEWVESKEPKAKDRHATTVTFNKDDYGEVSSAMIYMVCK